MTTSVCINPLIYIPIHSAQNLQREMKHEYSSGTSNMYRVYLRNLWSFHWPHVGCRCQTLVKDSDGLTDVHHYLGIQVIDYTWRGRVGGATLPCRCHSLCGGSAGGSASFSSPRSEALELEKDLKSNKTMKCLKPISFVTSEDVRIRTQTGNGKCWDFDFWPIFPSIFTQFIFRVNRDK